MQFFKDSIRELKHVVWPTREETRKYFVTVVLILLLFWLYLFIAWSLFSNAIFYFKDLIN